MGVNATEPNDLILRVDTGKRVEIEPTRLRQVEHGFVVPEITGFAPDRVLASLAQPTLLHRSSDTYAALARASQGLANSLAGGGRIRFGVSDFNGSFEGITYRVRQAGGPLDDYFVITKLQSRITHSGHHIECVLRVYLK